LPADDLLTVTSQLFGVIPDFLSCEDVCLRVIFQVCCTGVGCVTRLGERGWLTGFLLPPNSVLVIRCSLVHLLLRLAFGTFTALTLGGRHRFSVDGRAAIALRQQALELPHFGLQVDYALLRCCADPARCVTFVS
jgi:hypothetical protein